MSFVITKKAIFLSIGFNDFVIQDILRGTNLLLSFGMKFNIILSVSKCFNLPVMISVNVKVPAPRKTGHAPFNSS